MNLSIIGTGYVGLVTGTCFAESGNSVLCMDIDAEKVRQMESGKVPIYEPGLKYLFERNIAHGRLKFTTNLEETIERSEVIFLALPTPPDEDGSADLSFVLGVAGKIGDIIKDYKLIITKSTVPVGTADKVKEILIKKTNTPFDVVSNPEFLREGFAVDDFMKPERIIVGTKSERAIKIMKQLYRPFVGRGNQLIFTDERTSELTKYAANAFLATKITFMNEVANLCEKTGANVDDLRVGLGSDTRIGNKFLFPGIGFGGSCFPKDVKALNKMADDHNYTFNIIKSVISQNQRQRESFVENILNYYNQDIKGKKIALWGLAFKPETDDIREAPALYIIDRLLQEGAEIAAYDPEAMENVRKIIGDRIELTKNRYDALNDADCLVICTEWSVFRTPSFEEIEKRLKRKVIFDGRNLYDLQTLMDYGFYYYSVGRPLVHENMVAGVNNEAQ